MNQHEEAQRLAEPAEANFSFEGCLYLRCDTRVINGRVLRKWERYNTRNGLQLIGTVLLPLQASVQEVVQGFLIAVPEIPAQRLFGVD